MTGDQKMWIFLGALALVISLTFMMGLAARKWERDAELLKRVDQMDRLRAAAKRRKNHRGRASAS